MRTSKVVANNIAQWKSFFLNLAIKKTISNIYLYPEERKIPRLSEDSSWIDILKTCDLSAAEIIQNWDTAKKEIKSWGREGDAYLSSLPLYSWVLEKANIFVTSNNARDKSYLYISPEKEAPLVKTIFHQGKVPIWEFQIANTSISEELSSEIASLCFSRELKMAVLICISYVNE